MNTVTGRFDSRDGAARAVSSLIDAGFEREEISMSDVGEPLFRQAALIGPMSVHEKYGENIRGAASFIGGLLGAAVGAMLLPIALSLPVTLRPEGATALAMGVGACIAFVFASRVASLLVADAKVPTRSFEQNAAPTIVGVRTLDAFARRAARILTRAGGAAIATEPF